jgi:hypothetical protein
MTYIIEYKSQASGMWQRSHNDRTHGEYSTKEMAEALAMYEGSLLSREYRAVPKVPEGSTLQDKLDRIRAILEEPNA